MSQDFSQYDQNTQFDGGFPQQSAPMQPRSSGCGKGCMIALLILLVLVGILVGVGIWVFNRVAKGITDNPQEIAQRLQQRFAGAELPEGYRGLVGIRFDLGLEMDMMIFGKEDAAVDDEGEVITGNTLILFSFKLPGMQQEELEDALQAGNNGGKVVEKMPYTLRSGEYEFDAFKQKVQKRRGEDRLVFNQILVPLGNSTVVVMQSNQNDKVDEEALKTFLKSVAKDCPAARKPGKEKNSEDNN